MTDIIDTYSYNNIFQHKCKYRILENYKLQLNVLHRFLGSRSVVSLGTLGPQGTSSYNAVMYFYEYLIETMRDLKIEVLLWNNFDLVFENLVKNNVDLIVVPNAYERITEMYWDPQLKHLFSFLLPTPDYGLAKRKEEPDRIFDEKVKIATCRPVICLVDKLIKNIVNNIPGYEIVLAESTTNAAEMLSRGEVDFAVTNATSLVGRELVFISEIFNADVLWSVFCVKNMVEQR